MATLNSNRNWETNEIAWTAYIYPIHLFVCARVRWSSHTQTQHIHLNNSTRIFDVSARKELFCCSVVSCLFCSNFSFFGSLPVTSCGNYMLLNDFASLPFWVKTEKIYSPCVFTVSFSFDEFQWHSIAVHMCTGTHTHTRTVRERKMEPCP